MTRTRSVAERRLRRAAITVLRGPDAVAQLLVPSRPNRVCYSSVPDYADNARAMYRHLLATRSGLEHVWFLRDMTLAERVRREFAGHERGHTLEVVPWGARSYPAFLRSRFVFHTHGMFTFSPARGARRSVSLWHGMPIKTVRRLHAGNDVHFDIPATFHLATSSFFKYAVASAFDAHPASVLTSGLPRTDVLKGFAEPMLDRSAVADRLGIDPERPWLLWTPTHRSERDYRGTSPPRSFLEATDSDLLDSLDDACAASGVEAVVKLHPYDRLNDAPTVDFPYRHLRLVTAEAWRSLELDVYDVAAQVAGLITDVSSILIDFLHTRRPIGMLGFDPDTYSRETAFDVGLLLGCDAVERLADDASIRSFVERVADGAMTDADAGATRFFVEDSAVHSAEAVAAAVGL